MSSELGGREGVVPAAGEPVELVGVSVNNPGVGRDRREDAVAVVRLVGRIELAGPGCGFHACEVEEAFGGASELGGVETIAIDENEHVAFRDSQS